jgi:hypothetical protein
VRHSRACAPADERRMNTPGPQGCETTVSGLRCTATPLRISHPTYRTIIHSEGMYFIGRIPIHISPSADFRLWPKAMRRVACDERGHDVRVIAIDQNRFGDGTERWGETMLINLKVNGCTSRVGSADELKQELAPFASQQFREIWVRADSGGPSLCALMNTNAGWLMYLSNDDGAAFSSRRFQRRK